MSKKGIFSIFVAFIIAAAAAGCAPSAKTTEPDAVTEVRQFEFYKRYDDTYFVKGCAPEEYEGGDELVIPSEHEGKPVSGIFKNGFKGYPIKSVVIPDSIVTIEEKAFMDCAALESVDLPTSVKTLGFSVFANCSALNGIDLTFVTDIGSTCFYNCAALRDVYLSTALNSYNFDMFSGCYNIEYNEYSGGRYLGTRTDGYAYLVDATDEDGSFTISPNAKVIFESAFSGIAATDEVIIPSSVRFIGASAFMGSSFKRVTFASASGWKLMPFGIPQGNDLDLSDPAQNAVMLKFDYYKYPLGKI